MLDSFFTFRGRIGRVRFLLSGMALGPALLLLFVALLFAFGYHPSQPLSLFMPLILASLVVGPLWLWTSLSLQACRLRDIGLDPVPALSTWLGINFALRLFDRVVVGSQIGSAHAVDPLGVIQMILCLAVGLALLLWPGWKADDDLGGRHLDVEPTETPPPAREPRLPQAPAAAQATGFGRRGLAPGRTGVASAR